MNMHANLEVIYEIAHLHDKGREDLKPVFDTPPRITSLSPKMSGEKEPIMEIGDCA